MSSKYSDLVGRVHLWKESIKEKWTGVREEGGVVGAAKARTKSAKDRLIDKINGGDEEYNHLYRRKTRQELLRVSSAVMGIEFAYAAETAFVSPTLLKIGVRHSHMTLIWCLSPLIGFFLTPVLGSLSDRCGSRLGRRRPFVILLSIGVILGLILVPNGKLLGKYFGDRYPAEEALDKSKLDLGEDIDWDEEEGPGGRLYAVGQHDDETKIMMKLNATEASNATLGESLGLPIDKEHQEHPWGVFFTVMGTVLLDFDADACQSPSRAYLLDVTLPEDHAVGLSTFTIMAGLGGSLGYVMGATNWGWLADLFGGHVRLVFSLILVIFIICVAVTLTSFAEIPLKVLEESSDKIRTKRRKSSLYYKFNEGDDDVETNQMQSISSGNVWQDQDQNQQQPYYGATEESPQHVPGNPFAKKSNNIFRSSADQDQQDHMLHVTETSFSQASPVPLAPAEEGAKAHMATIGQYLWSIIYMPNSLRVLCLTNLFCWMSLVCYSLYFTDFVGEAVFGGNPQAAPGTDERKLYDEGVQFGCWGMAMYSLSCSCYSFIIEKLVTRFRAKPVYVGGQLVYCVGMIFMALSRSAWGVILFSWSAGVMYSTLFTMPYLLVAHYHEVDPVYSEEDTSNSRTQGQIRGIGTDVGIVSCMVFLAQFILSLTMGSIISWVNSTVAVIISASVLSFCGSVTANFVTYHNL